MDAYSSTSSNRTSSSFSSPSTSPKSSVYFNEAGNIGSTPAPPDDPIAIIGMSLKLPGDVTTEDSFWNMMMDARSTASTPPPDRFNHSAHYCSNGGTLGVMRPQKAHFLGNDWDAFDTSFFGLTAEEAKATDPQQRGLLEISYRAFENAGISVQKVHGTDTAVHVGCFTADYLTLMAKDPETMPKYTATGVSAAFLSNRISSFFNLLGPSVTVDTACSSSLVALDQACQVLRSGQSSMGLVAGCNLIFALDLTIALSNMGFLSPDGVCHSFDHKANGYARGEGFGAVVIKRLRDAVRDGDTIRAVIRATGVNQNGTTALAQPSKVAQARLIAETYRKAGLNPLETKYVEAHGTGTAVGDPIEAAAIGTSFAAGRSRTEAIYVSSLKANFGHLEGAAGIAGVIKTVLVLERGIIPPLAGLERINPDIDTDFLNIKFPLAPALWPTRGLRRASINSFGFGGTNAHAILDDACHYMHQHGILGKHWTNIIPSAARHSAGSCFPGFRETLSSTRPLILTWSAHDETSMKKLVLDYAEWLKTAQKQLFPSLAHTLNERRSLHSWRTFAITSPLENVATVDIVTPIPSQLPTDLSLAFVFTGQGAQWCGMGRELFVYEVFRKSVFDAISYLVGLGCYWNFAGAFFGDLEPATRMNEPGFAQPLCTILQIALVQLLASVNIRPSLTIGHSSGEIAAAYACGAISRECAWKLAYYRGICSNEVAAMPNINGGMLAVGLSQDETKRYLDIIETQLGNGNLAIACVNSPSSVTVSGDKAHVGALAARLQQDSIFSRVLHVPVAYHGPHMELAAGRYLDLIGEIKPGNMALRHHVNMVSSVTGERVEPKDLREPSYWVRNLVSQVQFAAAVQATFASPRRRLPNKLDLSHRAALWVTDLLEIGPHAALGGPIRQCLQTIPHSKDVPYNSVLVRGANAHVSFLGAVGRLHCRGFTVHLNKVNEPGMDKSGSVVALPILPQYPFNHSTRFWFESRISKGIRFRDQGRRPFLGTPISDWNPLDARWRQFIKPADSSWIADHTINGKNIYPAAGMLTMAIEAAAQLAGNATISAFEISDAVFHSALDMPAHSDGVEVQLQLIAHKTTSQKFGFKHNWFLRAYRDGWHEICSGAIRTVLASDVVNEVDHGNEEIQLDMRGRAFFDKVSKLCSRAVSGTEIYEHFWTCGYHYGPSFKRIQSSEHSLLGEAKAKITAFDDTESEMPTVIHPTTLDGMLQIVLPVITDIGKGSGAEHMTSLPTRVGKLWISTVGLNGGNTEPIDVAAQIRKSGFRNSTAEIAALSQEGSCRLLAHGIETTLVTDGLENQCDQAIQEPLCWNLVQKIDPDYVEPDRLHALLTENIPHLAASCQSNSDIESISHYFMKSMNSKLNKSCIPKGGHLQKYLEWMQNQLAKDLSTLSVAESTPPLLANLTDDSKRLKAAKLYYYVGEHLEQLIAGRLDPQAVLFEGTYMSDFYEENLQRSDFMIPVSRYLDLLSHKNPKLAILEIGAGRSGLAKHLLKSLTQQGSNGDIARYSTYCFDNTSASSIDQAQLDISQYSKVEFRTFDLEEHPLRQGFSPESFDIIVAPNVIHATKDVEQCLANVRTLLKPGGKLIAVEVTAPDRAAAGFVSGLLPSWWLGEDAYRNNRLSPYLLPHEWNNALSNTGYSGVDHIFWDTSDEEYRLNSLWISTKLAPETLRKDCTLDNVILVKAAGAVDDHVRLCHEQLEVLGVPLRFASFSELATQDRTDTLLIIYDSQDRPILQNLGENEFGDFRTTLVHSRSVLWVSNASDDEEKSPFGGAVHGLSRTIKSELFSMNFTVFQADTRSSLQDQSSNLRRIISHCLLSPSESCETEWIERDGMLHIRRIVEDITLNNMLAESGMDVVERKVRFGDENLTLTVKTPGLLDSLYFKQVKPMQSELGSSEVEVRVKVVGVNFKDCLVALGRVADETLGTECAGIVERVGSSSCFHVGDRVVVSALDTYRSVLRCQDALVAKIPDGVTFAEAAKLPTNFITAYHALVELGRISEGERVLIHGGAGGTGQAAIQIAQHFGAEVFTTVSSQTKKDLLVSRYGIPADHIFYSRDTSFAQSIKRATPGGVDVILNSLAGEQLQASWECIAPYGRFFEIGKKDIFSHERLPMFQFAQNVSFSAIDVAAMTKDRPQLIQKALKAVLDLLMQKKIRVAFPLKVFSVHQIEEAFRYLQNGKSMGGAVIEIDQDAVVQAQVSSQRNNCFEANATYMIAGGLGGQGKSIAKWMGKNGAKNILILSRRGNDSQKALDFIEEMRTLGTYVKIAACDISDALSLRTTVNSLKDRMPPIKGCIQAAMVIQDAVFDSMTYSQWTAALKPKIDGSWNLHAELPSDLDFFVLLSSSAGLIGSAGQANYCAGNTYQDALAAYRLSRNQKAVSIDLSLMKEEGYFVGREQTLDQFARSKQLRGMSQGDLFTILQYYCDPRLKVEEMKSQVAMGFSLPSEVRGRGDEPASWMDRPLFAQLHQMESNKTHELNGASNDPTALRQDDLSSIIATKSRVKASPMVSRIIQEKLSQVFSRTLEQIDTTAPIHSHGVDSLIAVELRNWLLKRMKIEITVFEILGGSSVETLSSRVVEKLGISED